MNITLFQSAAYGNYIAPAHSLGRRPSDTITGNPRHPLVRSDLQYTGGRAFPVPTRTGNTRRRHDTREEEGSYLERVLRTPSPAPVSSGFSGELNPGSSLEPIGLTKKIV